MFHSLFNSQARSRYLSLFSHFFSFILWSAGIAKSTILLIFFFFFFFFLLLIIRSGLLDDMKWSVCISKSHRSLYVSFSTRDAILCIYHLLAWSNLNFLHISQWITLPTQSCLVLYLFLLRNYAAFAYNVIYSFISDTASLHLLFCCVLSILALIWLVLMALFCAAMRRDSVSLLEFAFLSHVQVLSCEMLFINRLKRPWTCFSSHFCFLVFVILLSIVLSVFFLMAVISPHYYYYYYYYYFPVDHLAHPDVSSLVLLLCQFAAFAYYGIESFISVTA